MQRKRLYISIGFDVTNFLSGLLERNFTSNDSIVLIIPKKRSERNEEAIKKIELFLSELKTRGLRITMEVLELDEENPLKSMKILINHMKEWDGEVYLDAVGGLRVFCVIMAVVGMIVPRKNMYISSVAENTGKRITIPRISLTLISSLSGAKFEVLNAIRNEIKKLEEIEKKFKKDKSTISRHLTSLEEMDLIKKVRSKPAEYEITELGELIIDSLRAV